MGRVEVRVRSTPRPTLLPRRTPAVSRKTYSLPSRLSVWLGLGLALGLGLRSGLWLGLGLWLGWGHG